MKAPRQLPWRLLAVAAVVLTMLAWFFWPRLPLPQRASRQFLEAVLRSDYDWIYDHSFEQDRALPGFDKNLIQSFCDDHLSDLKGAKLIGNYRAYLDEPNRGMSMAKLRLKSGREVEIAAQGFGEEGEVLVGAMEGLFALRFLLDSELGRQRMTWAAIRPWFKEHGVDRVYFAQVDQVFDLNKAQEHDASNTK